MFRPKDNIDKKLQDKNIGKIYVNPKLYGIDYNIENNSYDYNCEDTQSVEDNKPTNNKNLISAEEVEDKFNEIRKKVKELREQCSDKDNPPDNIKKEIENLRQSMQDVINPNRMYERLGEDILKITIGKAIVPLFDPELKGKFLTKIAELRIRLTDELGYIIPNIRTEDDSNIEDNKYEIYIRGKKIDEGFVYTNKYMVIANQWNQKEKEIPINAIKNIDPKYKIPVYWLDIGDIEMDIFPVAPDDVIITHLKHCVIKYAHQIISKTDALKIMEIVISQDPTLVNDLIPIFLSPIDLKKIMANLISQNISIKDIILVFEILNDHARYTQDVNELTEILKKELNFANK